LRGTTWWLKLGIYHLENIGEREGCRRMQKEVVQGLGKNNCSISH
jgi:hypothetical protein